ncbi:MAG TPA: patatin-like phospholipase family protein [Kofleriaceae bacterium]
MNALILGAGGPAANSFELGIVAGLADGGVDVRDADLFVGTSAGARVAVKLAGATATEELYRRSLEMAGKPPSFDVKRWRAQILDAKRGGGAPREILKRIRDLALSVHGDGNPRLAEMAALDWPAKRVAIVAVEVESGERRVFERHSGVKLADALAASGAMAGVWPAVTIDGKHYVDGGMYSTDNADVAGIADRVLVIALRAGTPRMPVVGLEETTRTLEHVLVIQPDDNAQAALLAVGGNVLDPAVAQSMASAARAQGLKLAPRIEAFWHKRRAA